MDEICDGCAMYINFIKTLLKLESLYKSIALLLIKLKQYY